MKDLISQDYIDYQYEGGERKQHPYSGMPVDDLDRACHNHRFVKYTGFLKKILWDGPLGPRTAVVQVRFQKGWHEKVLSNNDEAKKERSIFRYGPISPSNFHFRIKMNGTLYLHSKRLYFWPLGPYSPSPFGPSKFNLSSKFIRPIRPLWLKTVHFDSRPSTLRLNPLYSNRCLVNCYLYLMTQLLINSRAMFWNHDIKIMIYSKSNRMIQF